MRRMRLAAAALALSGGSVLGMAGPASAAGNEVDVVCGNTTYTVAVNGQGAWTPGRVVGSNKVLHPTSFGEVHGTVTFKDGSGSDEFTDPPMTRAAQPQAHNGKATLVDCTFSDDFEDAYVIGHVEGTVSGWIG